MKKKVDIILGCLIVAYCIVMVIFFAMSYFYEGIFFSLIPIVLIVIVKYNMKVIKELALITLGAFIVTYFVLVFVLLKMNYIFIGILLILVLIGIIYSIRSKKKIIIVLLDALYSFCRFLLWFLIFASIFIAMFWIIIIINDIVNPPLAEVG